MKTNAKTTGRAKAEARSSQSAVRSPKSGRAARASEPSPGAEPAKRRPARPRRPRSPVPTAEATASAKVTAEPPKRSRAEATADLLRILTPLRPTLGLVLGSGFNHLESEMKIMREVPYAKLPGFPPAGVTGHRGRLLVGHLGPTPVVVLSGRAHYYEGHSFEAVTFAVRVLAAWGVSDLLLTNAAGGISSHLRAGDFMVVTDHINFMGGNPLRGETPPGRPRFVDLTQAYDPTLTELLHRAALECRLSLQSGVYLAVSGPNYETPAEVRAFGRLGADAVGMSTVPEVLVARQWGLRVAALSCITNQAAGICPQALSHDDVLETAERVKTSGTFLLKQFARIYGQNHQV